jgi:chitin disaccharide deacetylase
MVGTPFSSRALQAAPPSLAVGLHAVLDPGLSRMAAGEEIRRQLARFEELCRRPPTHLDSHKHAHATPAVLLAMAEVACERGLPVRALDAAMRAALRRLGARTSDHFLGDAALRPCWTPGRLLGALAALAPGTTELMCHPGYEPEQARTTFGREREVELAALTDPRAAEILRAAGVSLVRQGEP